MKVLLRSTLSQARAPAGGPGTLLAEFIGAHASECNLAGVLAAFEPKLGKRGL